MFGLLQERWSNYKKKFRNSDAQRRHMERWGVFFVGQRTFLWSMNQRMVCARKQRWSNSYRYAEGKRKCGVRTCVGLSGGWDEGGGRHLHLRCTKERQRVQVKRMTGGRKEMLVKALREEQHFHVFSPALSFLLLKHPIYELLLSLIHTQRNTLKDGQVWIMMSDHTYNVSITSDTL